MFSAFWHNDIVSLGGLLSKNVFLAPVGYDSPQENQIQCSFEYYFTVLVDPLWILFIPTLSSVYCFFFMSSSYFNACNTLVPLPYCWKQVFT